MITEEGLLSVISDPSAFPNLSLRQMAVLFLLARKRQAQMCELSAESKIARPVVTHSCNKLLEFGLIKRWHGPKDMRQSFAAITPRGLRYLAALANGKARAA